MFAAKLVSPLIKMLCTHACELFSLSYAQIWVTIVAILLDFSWVLGFLVIGLQIFKLRNTNKRIALLFC
jgi:hypothetical protein